MNVIDLFAGCGGLSLGFMKDNYTIKKGTDNINFLFNLPIDIFD